MQGDGTGSSARAIAQASKEKNPLIFLLAIFVVAIVAGAGVHIGWNLIG